METTRRVSELGASKVGHTATLLPSGKVLVAGGLQVERPKE